MQSNTTGYLKLHLQEVQKVLTNNITRQQKMKAKLTQTSLFDFEEPATEPLQEQAVEAEPILEAADNNDYNETTVSVVLSEPEEEIIDVAVEIFSNNKNTPVDFTGTSISTNKKSILSVSLKSKRGRKSVEEMTASVDLVDVPPDEILFQKRYYSIGKVAEMFNVNQSLIRLWENEFDVLKPKKNGKGDRFFRPEDIKNIQLIHHLMRERKYTMEGAKDYFKNNRRADENFAMIESLKKIKNFLLELKANL
jgi:DNA-binding transcriptional MerR regulator